MMRSKAIQLLLIFSYFRGFKLFQMNVKSAFFYGYITQDMYIEQPQEFESDMKPDHIYKLKKGAL